MPFKIVSTRRRGRAELCTVPFQWEHGSKLRWPKYNAESLCKDEKSTPRADWITFNCTLKRSGFLTFQQAEDELGLMLNKTDTDTDDQTIEYGSAQMQKSTACPNLNSLAEQLINPNEANGTYEDNSSSVITDSNGVIYELVNEENSGQTGQTSVPQQLDNNIAGILLQQIENVYVVQKVIMDNQEKIMKKIAELSVQLECNREPVTTLSQAQGMQTQRIIIKAIDNIEGLQQLDMELSTPEGFKSVQEKYSILCSKQRGNGINCSYRLLDALFSKDFLCKCSWTGGSRKADVKIGFKGYKNIINFFFVMVNSWDDAYTMENNEHFFKTILRNALKRKESKNIRLSAPKKRVKKNTSEKNDNGKEKNSKACKENESNDNGPKNGSKDNGLEHDVLPENSQPQNESAENRQAEEGKSQEEVEEEESLL